MDVRIAERRAEVRRERMLRRRRRSSGVALLAVLLTLFALVERSQLVALSTLEVTGTERLSEGAVRAAAGLEPGTSILRLDLGAARQRVEALPLVRDATVARVDPLTVAIHVEERRPVLVLESAGTAAMLGAEGTVLEHLAVERGRPVGAPPLPIIATTGGPVPAPGSDLSDLPAAANAVAVYRVLPGPVRVQVRRYETTAPTDLELVLDSGLRVRFGRAERSHEKARTLGTLLARVDLATVTAIDVRAPSRPVVISAGPAA